VRADQAADTADAGSIELISQITGGVDAAHAAALQRNAAAAAEGLAGSTSELKQKVGRQSGHRESLGCRQGVHSGQPDLISALTVWSARCSCLL